MYSDFFFVVFDVTHYRRKSCENHEMFCTDLPTRDLKEKSFHEALQDAVNWLQETDNHIAILDGPNVSRKQRQDIYDLIHELHFKITFIECICEDPKILEQNIKDILKYNADYKDMATENALRDLTQKMTHYKVEYESPSLTNKCELNCPIIKLFDGGNSGILTHGITGIRESKILSYLAIPKKSQQVLYFSRVSHSKSSV